MNIKGRLEAEADSIVAAQRKSGADIHDLLAKHAKDHAYGDEQVRSLTWLVNRHAFKQAMTIDKKDEMKVAHAHRVMARLHGKEETAVKSASCKPGLSSAVKQSGSATSSRRSADDSSLFLGKLAARHDELSSQMKAANAMLRNELFELGRHAQGVKRLGLEKVAGYAAALGEIDPADRRIVELAITHSPIEKIGFTKSQLRMLIPQALEETRRMGRLAKRANQIMIVIGDCQDRLDRVRHLTREIKGA